MRALLVVCLLLAPLPARALIITKLPMLQSWRTSEVRVQWETDANPPGTEHRLEWGLASPAENFVLAQATIQLSPSHFVHRAVATGLTAQTAYLYRVGSGGVFSTTYSLRTAPLPATPFRMAFLADNQDQYGAPFLSVLTRVAARSPDVIGHAGDTVQNGDNLAEFQSQWFTPFEAAPGNLGQRVPVLVARGNHDAETPQAVAYHWLPSNSFGPYWYAETIGRVRFLFLDSNLPWVEQVDWLRAELASPASRDADFRVAVFHKPPYTNLWDQPGYDGEPFVRDTWVPVLEQGNVDLVVNGHAHCYQRYQLNGVTYAIVGGAGGALDTVPRSPPWPFIQVAQPVHHYAIADVDGRRLRWTAYDLADQPIDSFVLVSPAEGIPVFPTLPSRGVTR